MAVVVFFVGHSTQLHGQGCVPARFMALSLGPDGITLLQPGEWQVGTAFRYLYADEGWLGTHRWPAYSTVVGNRITVVSTDLQATYAVTARFSTTLTVPYTYGQTSNPREHDGSRHVVTAHGIGDVRLVGNLWLFDPTNHPAGNISIGLGLKLPTGDEAATATFHKPGGPQVLPVDISIQPGDGGWGGLVELSGFRRLSDQLHGYVNGFYLVNPREQNKAFAHAPILGQIRQLSVPDQYLFRTGLSWAVGPARGLSLTFGGRIDGVPPRDLVGGSEGFRRPGFVIYAEPGLNWMKGRNTFNVFVPVRLDANRQRNVYDQRTNTDGGGAFASFLIVTSFSRTF
ncbi:MAG: hypothetical protein ABIV50_08405 [Opitutus sp.]